VTDIKTQKNQWEEIVLGPVLRRYPERNANGVEFATTWGERVERLYTPEEVEVDYGQDLGFPGQYPFTRGVQPTMYRGRLWTMRQYAGYATAAESNARYKYLLEQGQTGLSVAFDLPTQIGYDADHPLAEGEVGKVGVSISSIEDMRTLFDGIPLDKVSVSMTINAPAAVLLAMVVAIAEEQGVAARALRGTIQNDILKEYIARGTFIYPPKPSMRLVTDAISYCTAEMPQWNAISISGYHMREAGCDAVQEVAFTMANAIAYVEAAGVGRRSDRHAATGQGIDDFAGSLSFFFAAHNNLLEEVAKFRAARRLWARLVMERFGAKNADSARLRFHTQTAGCTLTAQQPDNNIVRVAIQALAAVLGGTQSLHTNSKDEALWLPTEQSVQTALRTQQIIAHESGVTDTIDPLAGSYYVEWLTDRIETEAQAYIQRIDDLGGAIAAIEAGYVQRAIQESAYRTQRAIDRGEQIVVGVNRYRSETEANLSRLVVDPLVEQGQRDSLARLRTKRDENAVQGQLARVREAAQGNENLMPILIEAVKVEATLGEICDALREVFGEYQQVTTI
jgi:methylmalonyl-CoA mutase, N-terminal domain